MSVKPLVGRIMDILSKEEPCTVSDDAILSIIDEGQRKLSLYAKYPETEEVELSPGESEVYFPSRLIRLIDVFWRSGTTERRLSPKGGFPPVDDMFQETVDEVGAGDPQFYYVKGDKIVVTPVPNVTGNVYLVYSSRPHQLVSISQNLAYPDSESFLLRYVLYHFYLAEKRDHYQANHWKPLMDESLMEWIHDSFNQVNDQPIVVKNPW